MATMTAMQLRQSIADELAAMPDDIDLLQKVKDLVAGLSTMLSARKYITKEELLAGINAGLQDFKNGRGSSAREFLEELRNER